MTLARRVGEGDAVEDRIQGEKQVEVETVQRGNSLATSMPLHVDQRKQPSRLARLIPRTLSVSGGAGGYPGAATDALRLEPPIAPSKLLADLLDDSSAAVRERQAHLRALRTERTRVEGAIQNMFDFIEQGIVSPRDTDFAARLAGQRARRATLNRRFCSSSDNCPPPTGR